MYDRSLHVPVIHRRDYTVSYEYSCRTVYGHVEVRRWSHKVAKAILKDIETAHSLLEMNLYALEVPSDPRQPKFLALCGFEPVGQIKNMGGQTVRLYERTKRWSQEPSSG